MNKKDLLGPMADPGTSVGDIQKRLRLLKTRITAPLFLFLNVIFFGNIFSGEKLDSSLKNEI